MANTDNQAQKPQPKKTKQMMYCGTNVNRATIAGKDVCFVPGSPIEVDPEETLIKDLIVSQYLRELTEEEVKAQAENK